MFTGTAAYWNSSRSDLLAMVNSLPSLPTWFITLSSRDLEWSDLIAALLQAKNFSNPNFDLASVKIEELSFQERSQLLSDFPVVAARHFDHRFRALLNFIKDDDKLLGGKVEHHWWRIEFQARGSPHVHMLVWVENAPAFDTPEGLSKKFVKLATLLILIHYIKRHRFH